MRAVIKRGGKVVASFEGEEAVTEALKAVMAMLDNPAEAIAALLLATAMVKERMTGTFDVGSVKVSVEEVNVAG